MTEKTDTNKGSYRFNDLMTCRDMAELIVDALVDGQVVKQSDFEKAVEITEEEIMVRKVLEDESNE